jgi:hypothetical protein
VGAGGGGGGGAGGAGGNASYPGIGAAGAGRVNDISGTSVTYAAGGGAGAARVRPTPATAAASGKTAAAASSSCATCGDTEQPNNEDIMSAGTFNIVAEQGATYNKLFTLTNSAGDLIDLTGYTARLQVREKYSSETKLLDLTTENGGITLGGAAGTVAVLATATQMAAITVPDLPGTPTQAQRRV